MRPFMTSPTPGHVVTWPRICAAHDYHIILIIYIHDVTPFPYDVNSYPNDVTPYLLSL